MTVAGYSLDQVRDQCVERFAALCDAASVSDDVTLPSLVHGFIASDEAALNATIGHYFYDRLHFEVCLGRDISAKFNNQSFRLRDVLREMAVQCDVQADSCLAKQQFSLRIKCVERDLRERFPVVVTSSSTKVITGKLEFRCIWAINRTH